MRYIQLDSRSLPTNPSETTVFPYLEESIGLQTTTYRFSLLVAPGDGVLSRVLVALGFEKQAITTPLQDWSVWAWGKLQSSPFKGFTEPATTADSQLSTYLALTLPADGEFCAPTAIAVSTSQVADELWNSGARFEAVKGIEFVFDQGAPHGWTLRFSAADGDAAPAVSFHLPLVVDGNLGAGDLLVQVELAPVLDSSTIWPGCTLRLSDGESDTAINNTQDVVYFGPHLATVIGQNLAFQFSHSRVNAFSLKQWAKLRFESDVLSLHLTAALPQVCLDTDLEGTDLPDPVLRMTAELELVMAPTGGASESLAEIVPLLADKIRQGLRLEFVLQLKSNAGVVILLQRGANPDRWEMGDFKSVVDSVSVNWGDESNLFLGGRESDLADLLGEDLNFQFSLGPYRPSFAELGEDLAHVPCQIRGNVLVMPVQFSLHAGSQVVQFCIDLQFDLTTFRLATNRLAFRLSAQDVCSSLTLVDLGIFAFLFPKREPTDFFADESEDGYYDFQERAFLLCAPKDIENKVGPNPTFIVPGNVGSGDLSQRLLFELVPFRPNSWPSNSGPEQPVYLRINSEGLSLSAKVITEHRPNVLRGSEGMRPLGMTPLPERDGRRSEFVLVNNVIRRAVFFFDFEVPSVDGLTAKVEVGMRQERRGKPPTIYAEVDLDRQNGKPIAPLSAGYLHMQIDDLRARLEWKTESDEWDLDVFVDASLFLSPEMSEIGGLDDLKDVDRLQVRNVNLLELHKGVGEIVLTLAKPLEFKCLDEKFLITFTGVRFQWGQTFVFMCDEALIQWLDKGTLEISVEVGGVHLEFSGGKRLKIRNPSRIGIDVTISDSVRYRGEVAWVDNDREHYFAAAGTLAISGLPEAATLLKIGSGKKLNGQIVPNIVLYGSLDYEMQLFSGVVAKNFGAGIGINNRLTGIDERPTAEKMLANIDRIDPSRISGWTFVERNGFYMSIVGTTIIASNTGGNTETNVYVASLLLSIDVDLNIVAAGKLWLASSVDFVRQRSNWTRPALVGAVAILPRDRLLTAAIESRPNPAVESSKQLQEILNNGHIKLSFTLSPKLVDFYLEDLSYHYEFLGIQMLYRGSFRLAYFDSTLMVRAQQMITGFFSRELSGGLGGFRCSGDVAVAMEFGGLLSSRGIAAYGLIAAHLNLDVNAWIKIEFSFTIGCGRWKKRISFSKTFTLPSTRLELGLSGAVAFDESGQFGFAGEISISISICGYRLSIAPSLAFNDGVIKEVRQRVAVFEGRLEAYKQQLLSGGNQEAFAAAHSEFALPTTVTEEWLHYRSGKIVPTTDADGIPKREFAGWHLIIPAADQTWFTPSVVGNSLPQMEPDDGIPFPFDNHVRSVHFSHGVDGDSSDASTLTLLMPWDQKNWEEVLSMPGAAPARDVLVDAEMMLAETISLTGESSIPLSNYKLVSDPRVESSDREYWLDIDQVMLPTGVLPVRMKSAEQILQSGEAPQDFNTTYGRLVEYAWWSQRAIIQRRHRGADRSEVEDLEHRRGVVLYQLLTELRELAPLSPNTHESELQGRSLESPWQAREVTQAPNEERRLFGLVFWHKGPLPEQVLAKRVKGDDTVDVEVTLRNMFDLDEDEIELDDDEEPVLGEVSLARQRVYLLPPRQEYVVDRETQGKDDGRGRLLIRLPVHFDKEFLSKSLAVTSHFQVWRRMRGSNPVLVADQQLPPVTFLQPEEASGLSVAVLDPYLATDEFSVNQKAKLFETRGVKAGKTILEYSLKLIPIGDFDPPSPPLDALWQPVVPYLPEVETLPVDLAMVLEVDALYRPSVPDDKSTWTQFRFASFGQNHESSDRKTDGTESDAASVVTLALTQDWNDLQTPEQKPRFEIWAEERPIADSGFYAGAAEEIGSPSTPQDADVRRVSADETLISLDDKIYLDVARVTGAGSEGLWRIRTESQLQFREGFAYLFYIRPRYESAFGEAFGRLRPLRHFLSRQLPGITPIITANVAETHEWVEPPRLRGVGRIEWIDATVVDAVSKLHSAKPGSTTPDRWQIGVSASVQPFDEGKVDEDILANQRRRIGMAWSHPGWRYGGIELNIRDIDDSLIVSSRVCETSDAAVYQQSIRDFSNDAAWRLTRREKSARLSLASYHQKDPDPLPDDEARRHRVSQTLYLKSENPALRELSRRTTEFQRSLGTATDWGPASLTAAEWVRALNAYDRSPLNLNDPALERLRLQARALIRYLFLGLRPPTSVNVDSLTRGATDRIDQTLDDLLISLDEYQPDAADFDESDAGRNNARAAFLDADFGRKLSAIVRRRRIVGEDVLATMDDSLPGSVTDQQSRLRQKVQARNGQTVDNSWLPRGMAFEALRREQEKVSRELQRRFPHVESLLEWFPLTEIVQPKDAWAAKELGTTLDELSHTIHYNELDETPDWDRRTMAARVVGKAAGLTIAVQQLERQFAAIGLVMDRRPHHRVIVKTDSDGTKVPEAVRLRVLLSSADRATDCPDTGRAESSIVALFNLYERMGFAIDIAATDRLGQTVTQTGLLRQLRRAEREGLFELPSLGDDPAPGNDPVPGLDAHYVYLLAPREPDSEYRGPFPDGDTSLPDQTDYAWIGSAFLRLVVVPKSFHDLLLIYRDGKREKLNTSQSTDLRDWLTLRGIETNSPDEMAQHIATFARTLDFVHPRDQASEPLPTGKLLLIRVTPLELHYVTVPHLDGFAHVDWELPDRNGHRFEVSGRKMSRYELLLRWANNAVRPRLVHPGSQVSVRRVMTRRDGIDLPIPMPVSVIPHPGVVQFVLSLASAGVRSLLNQISAVRTGYRGYALNFRYQLVDQRTDETNDTNPTSAAEPKNRLSWEEIRKGMVIATAGDELPNTPPIIIATPRNSEFDTRLFRNERLVQLDEIPYFYAVSLDVHSLYDGDLRGPRPNAESGLLPIPTIDPARRLPSVIAYRQPVIGGEQGPDFEIEIVLSRLGELALPQELTGGIPIEKRNFPLPDVDGTVHDHELWDDLLPDPALGYHFYDRIDDDGVGETSESVYRCVIDLLMPWHPGYKPPADATQGARPQVRSLESDVVILDADEYPEIRLRRVTGLDATVPVVTVKFRSENLFKNAARRRMQVSCRGKLTPPTDTGDVI